MDGSSLAALRIERFLETEPVVWLSTISPDGSPHLVPTWFVWDGSEIVIRSKPGASKVRNLRRDPRAMLALGDAEDDFDIGLLRATARLEPRAVPSCRRASSESTPARSSGSDSRRSSSHGPIRRSST